MDENIRKSVAISVTEGRTVRDLFYNGLLDYFISEEFEIHIFSEAIFVEDFVSQFKSKDIFFHFLHPVYITKWLPRFFIIRRKLIKFPFLLKRWIKFEEKKILYPREDYLEFFKTVKPELLLTTHAHLYDEAELISSAHLCGIKTLGIVRSWDNVFKGIKSRPQNITCWNEINKAELIEFEGYKGENISIVGGPQFDQYFISSNIEPKDQFLAKFNLNPNEPIIFFASIGYFLAGNDETEWMQKLIELRKSGIIPENTQIICRLHPWSRFEHFEHFKSYPDVIISYCNRYWPSLTWYMNKSDMVEMANFLTHSDIVITPGSTVTLEAAIFDKPTIVPIFHTTQYERMGNYFKTWVLGKHFGRIKEKKLVAFAESVEEYGLLINKALTVKDWYKNEREQLVKDYIYFTDGQSTKRIFENVLKIINVN